MMILEQVINLNLIKRHIQIFQAKTKIYIIFKTKQSMFTQLKQKYSYQLSLPERETLVRQFIQQNKQTEGSAILKQIQSEYESVFNILKNHPQLIVEFIFQKLSVEDCLRLMNIESEQDYQKQGNGFIRLLNDIGKQDDNKDHQQYIEWFSKMYTKYSSIQKVLIFLRQTSNNYQNKFQDQFFPQFLADFIKASALAVQTYLKLKAQSPKFDVDYMQHGQQIVKYTETWVKNFYVLLLKNMRVPETTSPLRLAILNGVCDIIGALMQVQREGNIENSICSQILAQSYNYIKKITNINEFNEINLKRLRQNAFYSPFHKIVLPSFYVSNQITFPKQSYGFVMFHFLKESLQIYSDQTIINFLIPILNELSQFEYQFKRQIQKIFLQRLQSGKINLKTCFEGSFPVSILWFNLWHYHSKRNQSLLAAIDKLYQQLRKTYPKTYANSLKILSNFHIEDLDNEVNQFIGQKSLEIATSHPELLINVLRNVQWKNVNQKGQKTWIQVINQVSKNNQIKFQLLRLLRTKQNKTKFQTEILKLIQS